MRRYQVTDKFAVEVSQEHGGAIVGTLKDRCDKCELQADCNNEFCPFNTAMDALESLILAHACAGIDVGCDAYKTGVQTAIDALADRTT